MNVSEQQPGLIPVESSDSRGPRAVSAHRIFRRATAKRLYDIVFSFSGLLVLSPLLLLLAALIKLADGGKVFFWQTRIGISGRPFRICKFRTMISTAEQSGPAVTKGGDTRITGIGRILRKSKLDELPQLWNVLKGEMSLVGPRPEVPRYVERYTPEQREILHHKPGITDLASLYFRDEEALLRHANNVEEFYMQQCVPRKLRLNQQYAERANLLSDSWIILQTVCPYWIGVLVTHGILLVTAFCLAYGLVHDFAPPTAAEPRFWRELTVVLALQLGCLSWRKQCRGLLSYFSIPELRQIAMALGVAAMGLLALWAAGLGVPPRNIILLDALLSFVLLCGFRTLLREWREHSAGDEDSLAALPARVGIIGAGTSGARLARELVSNKHLGRIPVAFFDDDAQKWQKHIHEIPVVGMPECLLDGWRTELDEVIIAMSGAPENRLHEIRVLLGRAGLKYCVLSKFPIHGGPRSISSKRRP